MALPFLLVACGQSNPHLIPQSQATALQRTADQIASACSDGDKSGARAAVRDAQRQVEALPTTVSTGLQANLQAWIDTISGRIS